MSENYIVINGNRVDLTEEQVEALGVKAKLYNPYQRLPKFQEYYTIDRLGISRCTELNIVVDEDTHNLCNYFTNRSTVTQVYLHQLLYRKLLKFRCENGLIDTATWTDAKNIHYCIVFNVLLNKFSVVDDVARKFMYVYFSTKEGAERAIKEVVKPFIKEHPEFEW